MLTMLVFHSLLISLATSTTYSYHLQCPDISQRPLRASAYCASSFRSEYTCLYDTNRLRFSEQCNKNPDYVTRGEKYVITGRLRNVDCSSERYQPFPLWSNVSGVCLFRKTLCEGEGQVVFDNGSLISDGACRCDYKKGYTFIQQPKHNCFCIPSTEDCSCYISKCVNGLILSSDYKCVGEEYHNDSKCPALEKKSGSWQSQIIKRKNGEVNQRYFNKSDFNKVVLIGFGVCTLMLLAIVIWGEVWKPYKYKVILVLLLFVALLSSTVIAVIFVEHNFNTVAVGVSLLVACVVLGTVYVVYIFSTHQLVKPPNVYDELYELQIFKLLKAASKGDMTHLKRIYNQKYIDINDTDYDTRSALHLAACEGRHKAVEYLLKNNAGYLQRKDRCLGHTPAEDAEWHMKINYNNASRPSLQKVVDLLHGHKGLKKYKCTFKDVVAMKMMKAAEYGEVSVLKSLHDSGTDMNLSDPDGRTALHAAVERNQEKVINFLIGECKVSPFIRWRGQRAEDLMKPKFCKQKIADKLRDYMKKEQLEQEAVLNKKKQDRNEDEDLRIVRILNSALRGDIRPIRAYKAAGNNMTVSDYDKRTALHIAVNNNQELVVKYLLKECHLINEANTAKDRWGKTPFEAAKKEGNENILRLFRDYCPNIPNTVRDEKKVLSFAITGEEGDVETLQWIYKKGRRIIIQDSSGKTVWNVDVENWNIDAMTYLADKSKSKENKHKSAAITCKKEINLRQAVV